MRQRLMPTLGAVLATAVVGGVLVGSPVVSLVFVGPAVALVVYAAVTRRRSPAEVRWSGATSAQPVLVSPGTPRQVAAALARVESHQLAFSAWFGVGLGLLVVIFVAFALVYADDNGDVWLETVGMGPWFAHPLAGMTVVAVHRAATRPWRDGTDELFESCPTEPVVRSIALLRTAVVPALVFAAFLVAYGATIYARSPGLHGPVTLRAVPVLVAAPVLAAGAVCLGVAVGSWVRFGLAPVVAVVAVGFLSLRLATAGDPGWNGLSALSTFGPQADSPLLLPLLPTSWYLLWISALVVVVAVVAVLRERRDRAVWLTGGAAAGVALVAAVLATLPPDADEARRVADRIARPAAHQVCDGPDGARVQVCTYRGYGELRRQVLAAVEPVALALPASAGPVAVRQGFEGTEEELPAAVRNGLPDGIPAPAPGEVRIGYAAAEDALQEYRLLVAFRALGLTLPSDAGDDGPLAVDGEARGVVALWLASRGMAEGDALGLATVEQAGDPDEQLFGGGSGPDAFERGLAWPSMCGPVVWSRQDLRAARAVLREPADEVAAVVAAGFDRWSDPATGTDELLAELGLPSAGPYDEIVSRTESFC